MKQKLVKYIGPAILDNQDKIFGITMQCPKLNNDNFVYHIDIGSSRIFDISYNKINNIQDEIKYLFSKTPQILLIDNPSCIDKLYIIKSKMRNTRVHFPRPNYETHILQYEDLSYTNYE